MGDSSDAISETTVGLVLLVEDDPQIRDLLSIFLETSGCQVLATDDGYEALRLCREYGDRLDLLVTDIEMPKMRGFELAIAVARILPELQVLFVSGYLLDGNEKKVAEKTGWYLLSKPIRKDALIQIAVSLVRAGKRRRGRDDRRVGST